MEGDRIAVSGLIVWEGDQVVDLDLFTPDAPSGGGRLFGQAEEEIGAFRLRFQSLCVCWNWMHSSI